MNPLVERESNRFPQRAIAIVPTQKYVFFIIALLFFSFL